MGEYDDILVRKPIRTKGAVEKGSHYNDRGLKYGRSRDAGDVSPEVQRQVIDALKAAGKEAGLTSHDIDVVVSIVRYESGFNPDAANKSGSAAGLGSLKNVTRTQYNVEEVFDIETNAKAIIECYRDSKALARKHRPKGSQEELDRWTYGFYHDGPKGKDYGGKEIFSRPNGVKGWIGPIERSLEHPKGSPINRPSGFLEAPGPHYAPPTSGPSRPSSYRYPTGRPNPLGPMPPTWDHGALPSGPNRLAGDSPLNLPSASANLPFRYSQGGARVPVPPEQPAPAPVGYPTGPLPSDSPLFPRRNRLSEPVRSMTPSGLPQSGSPGSQVQPPINRLGPWPGTYPEGSPYPLQNGSRNVFGPWPGSYPPDWKNLSYPDIERLLGLYPSG